MRHRSRAKVFGRRPEPRKALFRGLATALLESERIETTLAKAKELRRVVEPLITLAKRGDLHARRQAAAYLYKLETVRKLFSDVGPRFKDRNGGYTRIFKIGRRRGDGAEMALIELVVRSKAEGKAKLKSPKKEKTKDKDKGKETVKAAAEKKSEQKKEEKRTFRRKAPAQ